MQDNSYNFHNETDDIPNEKPIHNGVSYIDNFHLWGKEEKAKIFQTVMEINGWNLSTKIDAFPYNNNTLSHFRYRNGAVQYCEENLDCATCHEWFPQLSLCSKCRFEGYCSKECQKEHWSEHKTECNNLKDYSYSPVNGKITAPHNFQIIGVIEYLSKNLLPMTEAGFSDWFMDIFSLKDSDLESESAPLIITYSKEPNSEIKTVYVHRPKIGLVTEDNVFISLDLIQSKLPNLTSTKEYVSKQHFLPAHKRVPGLSYNEAKWLLYCIVYADFGTNSNRFLGEFNECNQDCIAEEYGLEHVTREKFLEIRYIKPLPSNIVKFCRALEKEHITIDLIKMVKYDRELIIKFIALITVFLKKEKSEHDIKGRDLLSVCMAVNLFETQLIVARNNLAPKDQENMVTIMKRYIPTYTKLYLK